MNRKNESASLQVNVNKTERDKFSDFKIEIEGKTFPVHRVVLNSHSDYFRAMFENDMLESKQGFCEMKGVTEEGLEQCINFMYGEELKLDIKNIDNVLEVSHMWQLHTATEKCVEFLRTNFKSTCHFCIVSKRIASFYGFKELEIDCIDYISQYLSSFTRDINLKKLDKNDVVEIIGQSTSRDIEQLWAFSIAWASKQVAHKPSGICDVFSRFPVARFTTSQFRSFVWKNGIIRACDDCKANLATIFLKWLESRLSCDFEVNTIFGRNSEINSCLFVKMIAKEYTFRKIVRHMNPYIVSNLREIMQLEDFIEIPKKDFLYYMSNVNKDFKVDEFVSIVKWIKQEEDRHDVFPKIFNYTRLSSPKKWNISLEQCYFIKSLTLRFGGREIEKVVDEFMVQNFAKIAVKKEFISIHEEDLKKYLSSEEIYRCDDKIIWEAINRWINADTDSRQSSFPNIFDSLMLNKFSNEFLRNTICKDIRTRQSSVCMSRLMDLLLGKMDKYESEMTMLSHDIQELKRSLTTDQNDNIANQSEPKRSRVTQIPAGTSSQ